MTKWKTGLYQLNKSTEWDKNVNPNFGLWYNKFSKGWSGNEFKKEWLKNIFPGNIGDKKYIKELCSRQKRLLQVNNGYLIELAAKSRFLPGFGNSHPAENGLTFHHTLGVPYVPSSSFKGITRTYFEQFLNKDDEFFKNIFGSVTKQKEDNQLGEVTFLDILPQKQVQFERDVMTPHFSEYYQSGSVPGDWHTPSPIFFLAVNDKSKFQTGIFTKSEDVNLNPILEELENIFSILGVGGKTAVGYGKMRLVKCRKMEIKN